MTNRISSCYLFMGTISSSLSLGLTSVEHFEIFINTITADPTLSQQPKIMWINGVNISYIYLCWLKFLSVFIILVNIILDNYSNVYKTVFVDIKAKFFFKALLIWLLKKQYFSQKKMHCYKQSVVRITFKCTGMQMAPIFFLKDGHCPQLLANS